MLIGEFTHNLDPKKRLSIPVRFRKELGEGAVLTRGLDGCVCLVPQPQWRVLAERIAALPMAQADSRSFSRLLLSGASEVQFDSLGRILVPEYLKAYAALKREVVIAGGHAALLASHGARIIGIEWDPSIATSFFDHRPELRDAVTVVNANYTELEHICAEQGIVPAGILFDLGISR